MPSINLKDNFSLGRIYLSTFNFESTFLFCSCGKFFLILKGLKYVFVEICSLPLRTSEHQTETQPASHFNCSTAIQITAAAAEVTYRDRLETLLCHNCGALMNKNTTESCRQCGADFDATFNVQSSSALNNPDLTR